ncbi:O-methyltransferase-domain-containing protein [Aspergillus alliaceus]|uniref:O-methyltransferase-domain-containing protein n=1 Tax=Petromyces alliaceus TaxID=209559 RepID=A0A5N7BX37_PETAA|nr:O-methyltransferase-domain-containing protein [Aspergillus alliaceus]
MAPQITGYLIGFPGGEKDRLYALKQVTQLARSIEKPADVIHKIGFSLTVPMALKIAIDMELFIVLTKATSFVTWKELAAPKNAEKALVERITRVLVANGFAEEHGPGKYTSTYLSNQMTEKASVGLLDSIYQTPTNPTKVPVQYAYATTFFMEGGRGDMMYWADWFPVKERLLHGAVKGDVPFLVDVGGGRGHELRAFKQRFPMGPGQLVLEDLPFVIDDIQELDVDIKKVKYDFFCPQPVKGARAYYFKHILHDCSDENCPKILTNTAAAMKRGYSKILIEDYILPDQNADSRQTTMDMMVMVFCPGMERTQQMWTELLASVGLKVKKFWLPGHDGLGIIEAEISDS